MVNVARGVPPAAGRATTTPTAGSIGPAARTTSGLAWLCHVLTVPSRITNRRLNETGVSWIASARDSTAGTAARSASITALAIASISVAV